MEKPGLANTKWQTFAEHLATGLNATDAYLEAGYKSANRHTAETCASRLRRKPEVAAHLRELRQAAHEETREDTILSLKETLLYLTRIIRTSAATLTEGDELVQYSRTFKDGGTAIRLPDKLRALKLHAELAGHFDRPAAARPSLSSDSLRELLYHLRSFATQSAPIQKPRSKPLSASNTTSSVSQPLPFSVSSVRNPALSESTESPKATAQVPAPIPDPPQQNSAFRPQRDVVLRPPISPFEPWPDDPACQALLGHHPRRRPVTVIR